jgi:ABC-type multidrug transport system fused ATPase/permease subunit
MSDAEERKTRIDALRKGDVAVEFPKGKFIVLVGSWIIFIAIGIGALIDIVGPHTLYFIGLLSGFALYVLAVPILILILVAGGTIILTVWLMVHLLKNHAYGLLKLSMVLTTIIIWLLFGIIVAVFGWTWELIFLLIVCVAATILPILYFTIWKERLELAGGILQLCGKITHEEKELLVPGFLKVFFIGVLSSFGGIIAMDISAYTIPLNDAPWYSYVPLVIFLFVLFFYIYINTYFFNAIVTSISYIWYRKKDPKFKDGLTVAVYQLPDLALLAVFSSIIKLIRLFLQSRYRKTTGGAPWIGGGFRLMDGLIANIWFYVNYFTLPSIVIEDVPATTAIKRSVRRLFDNWADVLLRQWGVGAVFNTLQFLIIFLFAMGGGLFGFILATVYSIDMVVMVVIGVILFLFISMLVSKPFLNLLSDIYLTFLFGFVLDKESGFKYANNLPKELNDKLVAFFKGHPAIKRCSNCFTRLPEGVRTCPKCGTAYP